MAKSRRGFELAALDDWGELCRVARRSAEDALRRRPALTENLGTAARDARRPPIMAG